ncbi:MAG: hypothetical protein ACK559_33005, partial [bacterium]
HTVVDFQQEEEEDVRKIDEIDALQKAAILAEQEKQKALSTISAHFKTFLFRQDLKNKLILISAIPSFFSSFLDKRRIQKLKEEKIRHEASSTISAHIQAFLAKKEAKKGLAVKLEREKAEKEAEAKLKRLREEAIQQKGLYRAF